MHLSELVRVERVVGCHVPQKAKHGADFWGADLCDQIEDARFGSEAIFVR